MLVNHRVGLLWAFVLLITAAALPGLVTVSAASAAPAATVTTATFFIPPVTGVPAKTIRFGGPHSIFQVYQSNANASFFEINLQDATTNSFTASINSTDGKPISDGVYDDEVAASPQLNFSPAVNRAGCVGSGREEITDIAYDTSGTITRLAMNMAETCGDSARYYYGDILFNEPIQKLEPSPAALDLGRNDPGQTTSEPIQLTNTTAAPIEVTSLSPPAGFNVADGGCLDATIAPGGDCTLDVSFTPHYGGTFAGNLIVGYAGGEQSVALRGSGRVSATQLILTSQPGDPIGAGGRYDLTPAGGSRFDFASSPEYFEAVLDKEGLGPSSADFDWTIVLAPVHGQTLVAGHSYVTQRESFQAPGYSGLDVSGRAVGCGAGSTGKVFIQQYTFGAPLSPLVDSHILSNADIFFRQKCNRFNGYLYGELRFAAGSASDLIEPKYLQLSGPASDLGLPTRAEAVVGSGTEQSFEEGGIFAKPSTGAHFLLGAIGSHYGGGGPLSALGFPTSDQLTSPDHVGKYNHFEHGLIYWSPKSGAHSVLGPILARWGTIGWERSRLGYPTTDEFAVPGGFRSIFQHGYITWNTTTGDTSLTYT